MAGFAGRGKFGERTRSGAANHQIGARESRGHVVDKRNEFAFETSFREFLGERFVAGDAGLMDESDGKLGLAKIIPATLARLHSIGGNLGCRR